VARHRHNWQHKKHVSGVWIAVVALVLAVTYAHLAHAALHTCGGTNLTLTSQALAVATFSNSCSGRTITIQSCSATSLTWSDAMSNTTLVIKNLSCGTATASRNCITISSAWTGGSIDIDGVSYGVSAKDSDLSCNVLYANGTFSNVQFLKLRRVTMALNVSGAGYNIFSVAYFENTVAGAGSAAVFNVSDITVSGSAASQSTLIRIVYVGGGLSEEGLSGFSGFETFEVSGNKADSLTLFSNVSRAELLFIYAAGGITLTGSAASSIVMRSNSARGASFTSPEVAQLALFHGPSEIITDNPYVDNIANFVVDGFDATACTLSSSTSFARSVAVFFFSITTTTRLGMVHGGKIQIGNVKLGGQMSYAAADANGYGASVLLLRDNSGIKEISVTDSSINMNQGAGLNATGASVNALAYIADLRSALPAITKLIATNCAIRGKYSASGTTAAVEAFIIRARASITADGAADVLMLTGNVIGSFATMTSTTSYVCRGLLAVDPTFTLSGFETNTSTTFELNVQATEGAAFTDSHGTGSLNISCGNATSVTSTTTTTSSTTSVTSTTTTTSSTIDAPTTSAAPGSDSRADGAVLGGGAIAGITIGAVVVVIALLAFVPYALGHGVFFRWCKPQQPEKGSSREPDDNASHELTDGGQPGVQSDAAAAAVTVPPTDAAWTSE
jgi:hypothetical protein